ncbi:MAG: non-homologous end-joining DNA ligase [Vulcanimicrobiaceae bacterium]
MSGARLAVRIGSRTLWLSNLTKVLYPRDGFTKGDVIDYYRRIAPTLIPHLRGRPLTLQRYPNGIDEASFFEKHIPNGTPEWVARFGATSSEGGAIVTYIVCNDEPTLVFVANLAALILHAWTSRVASIDDPDFVFFDLDPGERCTVKTLARVALALRKTLQSIGLQTLVKTSGGMGLHVVVPLHTRYGYSTVKVFAEVIAHQMLAICGPDVTLERTIKKRDDRAVYLDYVQVGRGKTFVAPYSLRARDRAPVSTPLDWSEVEAFARKRTGTLPEEAFVAYAMRTIFKRIDANGDLWGGPRWRAQRLEPAIALARSSFAAPA